MVEVEDFRRITFFFKEESMEFTMKNRKITTCNRLETYQVVWDSLINYGRLNWQWTLYDLEKALGVAYRDVLNEFGLIWCAKGLIVTRSNLSVTWKIRPQMGFVP